HWQRKNSWRHDHTRQPYRLTLPTPSVRTVCPIKSQLIHTSKVHCGPRSSNHQCSLPSTCTSSPTHSRRRRGWWMLLRCLRSRHSPSAIIHFRKVSLENKKPCSAASFSAANVGPKSAYF